MLRMSTLMQQIARIRFGRVAGLDAGVAVVAPGKERFSVVAKVSPAIRMRPGGAKI